MSTVEEKVIAIGRDGSHQIELVHLSSGGWLLRKNGQLIGTWSEFQEQECLHQFCKATNVQQEFALAIEQKLKNVKPMPRVSTN